MVHRMLAFEASPIHFTVNEEFRPMYTEHLSGLVACTLTAPRDGALSDGTHNCMLYTVNSPHEAIFACIQD
jgi:hypothetical protein